MATILPFKQKVCGKEWNGRFCSMPPHDTPGHYFPSPVRQRDAYDLMWDFIGAMILTFIIAGIGAVFTLYYLGWFTS